MNTDTLIEETRKILKTRYAAMKSDDMEDSKLDILKDDFFEQLKALCPEATSKDMIQLYKQLDERGYITLITNDMLTFSKKILN